ncbi:hypothetical protein QBC45DRAFT_457546, partial [Copromyces sp. CBS 386.78]
MNHQDNQKPPIVRVTEMLNCNVKEGLYRVEPQLKNPRKFLEAVHKAKEQALKDLYEDLGVRTPISKGAMECFITTALWKKHYPYGQGSPAIPLLAQCEELCPEPDQRWALYLERRLREEDTDHTQPQNVRLEESASTSTPPPPPWRATTSNKNNNQPTATACVPTPQPMPSTNKISFRFPQRNEGSGKGSSLGTKRAWSPLDSDPRESKAFDPPVPVVSPFRSPTLYQDMLKSKCAEAKMGVKWLPSDDKTTVKALLIGDCCVYATAESMENFPETQVKEHLAQRVLETCSDMRCYCIDRTKDWEAQTCRELQRLLS